MRSSLAIVVEAKPTAGDLRQLKLLRWKWETAVRFFIVIGMTGAGAAMIAAGLLA